MSDKNYGVVERRLERIMDRAFPFKFWFWTMLFSPALLVFSNLFSKNSDSIAFYFLFFIVVYSVIFATPSFVVFYWIYGMLKKYKVHVWWLVLVSIVIPTLGLYLTLYVFLSGFQFSFFMYYFSGIVLSFLWLFLIGKRLEEE